MSDLTIPQAQHNMRDGYCFGAAMCGAACTSASAMPARAHTRLFELAGNKASAT
jgi:hypothetical protein